MLIKEHPVLIKAETVILQLLLTFVRKEKS